MIGCSSEPFESIGTRPFDADVTITITTGIKLEKWTFSLALIGDVEVPSPAQREGYKCRSVASGGGRGGIPLPTFLFAPPIYFLPPTAFFGRKKLLFLAGKNVKICDFGQKKLRISAKTFSLFLGDHLIFTETSPQSSLKLMKIWVKFNSGFQLCLRDFNFAPRSREAGDAPG